MARLAFTALFVHGDELLAIAREHILVYSKSTGELRRTTVLDARVRAATLDAVGKHIVTVDDNKKLRVLSFNTLDVLSTRVVAKKSDIAVVTPDGESVLLADKFGDILSLPLHPSPGVPAPPDNEPSQGELILGHVSTLTAFLLSSDAQYLISGDRDEHIRVSRFPRGFLIHTFCLGSTKFITALHIPPSAPEFLISGGGEDVLRVWRWYEGALVREVDIGEAVRPRIAVHPPVLKPHAPPAKKRRTSSEVGEDEDEEVVLAVSRIESFGSAIVFAVLGATALFYFAWRSDDAPEVPATVRVLELGGPVVDFACDGDVVWISLDAQPPAASLATATWNLEQDALVSAPVPVLSSVPEGEIDNDLYLPLALLPKHPDDEGWEALESGDPTSDKQRGRRKVKEQLKALHGTPAGN